MVTHEVARADDLDGSVTGEPHDLERQEVLAVVRHHEAGTASRAHASTGLSAGSRATRATS